MKKYFQIVPAAYLVFRKNEEVLLLRRFNTGYQDGNYSLPAGHFDGGESALQVAVREAKEEVGVTIHSQDLTLVHTLHRVATEGDRERIDLFFEVKNYTGVISNLEPQKCDELRWVSLRELPDNMVPEVRQALEMIAKEQIYSDLAFNS